MNMINYDEHTNQYQETCKSHNVLVEAQEAAALPHSKSTYRTGGDSFDVSMTSRSQSRSSEHSRSMSRSRSNSRPRPRREAGSSTRRKVK